MFSIQRLQDGKQYKVTENGTAYNLATPDKVIQVLEQVRANKTRVTFDFGNTETKLPWNESYDVSGYIGRTMGPIHSPILLFNRRSFGGGIILTDCILTIKESRGKRVLYSIFTESVKEMTGNAKEASNV